jgi:hypothetical protein
MLMGPWHEIYDLCLFFHQTTTPRPLIHELKAFWIRLRIREDIRQRWLHSSVNDTPVQPTLSNIFANDPKHYCYALSWLGCTQHSNVIDDTAVSYTTV